MQFKTWQEFFEQVDSATNKDDFCWDYFYEEMYQHFKARLMDETCAGGLDCCGHVSLPLKNKGE
jgi:hypothetical protein